MGVLQIRHGGRRWRGSQSDRRGESARAGRKLTPRQSSTLPVAGPGYGTWLRQNPQPRPARVSAVVQFPREPT